LGLIKHLTSEYGQDRRITGLLCAREVWSLPVINPDGLAELRRKNAAGVDLNRNLGVEYNNRGLLSRWRKWFFYPGTHPFSEPETQSVREFISSRRFVVSCSFHSFGNLINYPYGHTRKRAKDHALLRSIGLEMAARQPHRSYGVKQLSWLYRPAGNLEDELYERHGALSFCVEIGVGGFDPLSSATWFSPARCFNPANVRYHIENLLDSALYLIEIAGGLGFGTARGAEAAGLPGRPRSSPAGGGSGLFIGLGRTQGGGCTSCPCPAWPGVP